MKQTRIGIVDMGSNAIRFMIAEASGREHRIVESHRLAVRLGTPVFQSGKIPDATIADIVDAFRRFRTSIWSSGPNSLDPTRARTCRALERDSKHFCGRRP